MRDYFILLGDLIIGYGVCSSENLKDIYIPDDAVLIEGQAPKNALKAPPEPGMNWNIKTDRWEAPAVSPAIAWSQVRYQRDTLLAQSDWIVLRANETNTPIPSDWLTYRQELRDITEQPDPLNIRWPEKP